MTKTRDSGRQIEVVADHEGHCVVQHEVTEYLAHYRENHPDHEGPVYAWEEVRDAAIPA